MIFSDVSNFLQFRCYKTFVRRPLGSSSTDPRYCYPTVNHPPSVMVWGSFSSRRRGGLYFLEKGATMNGQRYQKVLEEHLLQFMMIHQCTTFMHDSAPCHKSKAVSRWLQINNVQVLDWLGDSPDLNPIENLWTVMKKKVASKNPQSITDLRNPIRSVWCRKIDTELCEKLVDSMPNRIAQVIRNRGYHSEY